MPFCGNGKNHGRDRAKHRSSVAILFENRVELVVEKCVACDGDRVFHFRDHLRIMNKVNSGKAKLLEFFLQECDFYRGKLHVVSPVDVVDQVFINQKSFYDSVPEVSEELGDKVDRQVRRVCWRFKFVHGGSVV